LAEEVSSCTGEKKEKTNEVPVIIRSKSAVYYIRDRESLLLDETTDVSTGQEGEETERTLGDQGHYSSVYILWSKGKHLLNDGDIVLGSLELP
jgi:hypothetical protein